MPILGDPKNSSNHSYTTKMKTTEAFTRGKNLIESILHKMLDIDKWQHKFMTHILTHCLGMSGRFNFLQMSREGKYNEQTYRNNFGRAFDFLRFNIDLVERSCSEERIIAFDPSYITKSGKHTEGLGNFYSGCASSYKKGLEIGGIAVIDVKQNTAYHLEAIQSPPAKKEKVKKDYTLVDHYADLIVQRATELKRLSNILVVDGYFSKYKFVTKICENTELTLISRLRDDANLRYIFHGQKQNNRGRPKVFDGKVDTKKIDKRRFQKVHSDHESIIYGAVVYSVSLKRKIKVAYVEFLSKKGKIVATKLFFSTDLEMDATQILKYYKARYQIEYLYRDSKQFTGLQHCQARSKEKLYFHFNTCLTAVSVAKVVLRNKHAKDKPMCLSISNIKTEFKNRKMIKRIISMYGFDQTLIKIHPAYTKLLNYGKIAA